MSEREIITTDIPGLDVLLGGGIPCRQSIAIVGNPGSGKTVLGSHLAFTQAKRGKCVILATLTSEPHLKLLDDLRNFAFYDESLIGKGVFLISAYPYLKKGAKDLKDVLLESAREHKASFLMLDGIRAVRELWRNEAQLREFLYELGVGLASSNCVAVFTSEYPIDRLMDLPEATTVDAIISVSVRAFGAQRLRRAEVVKVRGRNHLRGEHSMRIDDAGVTMIPRLENVDLGPARLSQTLPDGRADFALNELDKLLHGGLPRSSATTIIGPTGVGKTLLALHFAVGGCKRGETSMFVSFNEHPDSLIARAKGVGLEVQPYIDAKKLILRHTLPIELDVDDWAGSTLRDLRDFRADRLVVDSLGDLLHAVTDQNRSNNYLVALAECLKSLGVTTVFTKETPKIAAAELDFSEAPMPVAGENVILLRPVELSGKIHRVMSTLKMRSSPHDWHVREFVIGEHGFKVLDPVSSAEGLLIGSARQQNAPVRADWDARGETKR